MIRGRSLTMRMQLKCPRAINATKPLTIYSSTTKCKRNNLSTNILFEMKMTESPNGKRMPSTEKLICHASSTLKSKITCSSRIWRSTTTPVRASRSCTTRILTHTAIRPATPGLTAPDLAQEMLRRASPNTVARSKRPGSASRRLLRTLQRANFYPRPTVSQA